MLRRTCNRVSRPRDLDISAARFGFRSQRRLRLSSTNAVSISVRLRRRSARQLSSQISMFHLTDSKYLNLELPQSPVGPSVACILGPVVVPQLRVSPCSTRTISLFHGLRVRQSKRGDRLEGLTTMKIEHCSF